MIKNGKGLMDNSMNSERPHRFKGLPILLLGLTAACALFRNPPTDEWHALHYSLMQPWEEKIYWKLTQEGRIEFQRIFWDSRDEDAQTEFWGRVDYLQVIMKSLMRYPQRLRYSDKVWVFLLNGPPIGPTGVGAVGEDLPPNVEVWSYYYRGVPISYYFSGQRLLPQTYLESRVVEMEKSNREVFYGLTVDPAQYRADLEGLLKKYPN